MSLRLSVTYPATDGSMPENVEMEWSGDDPGPMTLMGILDRLLTAPQGRTSYVVADDRDRRQAASREDGT